jgi:hypothetical protein
VLFEFRQIGGVVRVCALDAERNVEVVLQGPASAGLEALKAAALRKLAYVLERQTSP